MPKRGDIYFNNDTQELLQVVSYKRAGLASLTLVDDDGKHRQFGSEQMLKAAGFSKLSSKSLPKWAKSTTKIDTAKKFIKEYSAMGKAEQMIEAMVNGEFNADEVFEQDKWIQGAIKKPDALRKELGVKPGEPIMDPELDRWAKAQ